MPSAALLQHRGVAADVDLRREVLGRVLLVPDLPDGDRARLRAPAGGLAGQRRIDRGRRRGRRRRADRQQVAEPVAGVLGVRGGGLVGGAGRRRQRVDRDAPEVAAGPVALRRRGGERPERRPGRRRARRVHRAGAAVAVAPVHLRRPLRGPVDEDQRGDPAAGRLADDRVGTAPVVLARATARPSPRAASSASRRSRRRASCRGRAASGRAPSWGTIPNTGFAASARPASASIATTVSARAPSATRRPEPATRPRRYRVSPSAPRGYCDSGRRRRRFRACLAAVRAVAQPPAAAPAQAAATTASAISRIGAPPSSADRRSGPGTPSWRQRWSASASRPTSRRRLRLRPPVGARAVAARPGRSGRDRVAAAGRGRGIGGRRAEAWRRWWRRCRLGREPSPAARARQRRGCTRRRRPGRRANAGSRNARPARERGSRLRARS